MERRLSGTVRYRRRAQIRSSGSSAGSAGRLPREGVASLLIAIQALKDEMAMPAGIRDTGVDAADFDRRLAEMVGQALRDGCTPTNPRVPDANALTELYRRAWTGGAVQGH